MKRRSPNSKPAPAFDPQAFLASVGQGRSLVHYKKDDQVFSQGDGAEAVYYIQRGKIKLTVVSQQGKEAVVAILGASAFFGEGCLAGQPHRMATATTMSDCAVMRLEKSAVVEVLHKEPAFSELFLKYVLSRNARIEEDLVDQLFNSSEKRLARVLLLLANFGEEGEPEAVIPKVSQETLAEIVGTTRSRVSFFMNRFRKQGFIEYNGELRIHSSLLKVVLHD
jgi:CRP-like cAMP-binding protein